MTVVNFAEYFWGEKNEGYAVLFQNMKCGTTAVKELSDFLREAARTHEENTKAHIKIVKQLSQANHCGTFSPLIVAFRMTSEKLAAIHNQWMSALSDLCKDVMKYSDELGKSHKRVKDEGSPTQDAIKALQDTAGLLQKSKELYKQRCLEMEKLKRDGASQKDLEKADVKFRKTQEEYKQLVDKYCLVRDDFEKKMTLSSRSFQDVEVTHLRQMREFVESYCKVVDDNNNQWGRVHQEFQIQLSELTVEKLLETFTLAKYTGLEKPGRWERFIYENSLRVNPVKSKVPTTHTSAAAARRGQSGPMEFEEDVLAAVDGTDRVGGGSSDRVSLGSGASVPSGRNKDTAASAASAASSSAAPTSAGAVSDLVAFGGHTHTPSAAVASPPDLLLMGVESSSSSMSTPPLAPISATALAFPSQLAPGASPSTPMADFVKTEENSPTRSPHSTITGWTGFLRRRQKKEKTKKKADDDGDSQKEAGSEGEDARKSQTPTPDVDEDGYSKQPATGGARDSSDPWDDFNVPNKSFCSSSDESDDESKKKIKVAIKPVTNGAPPISASIDELRNAIGGLEILAPGNTSRTRPQSALNERIASGVQTLRLRKTRDTTMPSVDPEANNIRRSQSQHQIHKHGLDLMTLHHMDPVDVDPLNTSTPGKAGDVTLADLEVSRVNSGLNNNDMGDFFGDLGVQQPSLPPKQRSASAINRPSSVQRELISSSLMALPRPPSRPNLRQRTSPSPVPSSILNDSKLSLARQDSGVSHEDRSKSSSPTAYSNVENNNTTGGATTATTSTHRPMFGISRGPSPLTLGMADIVPLAVAFQEVCHACFRGADENQCQVRLIGDMMVSFPAGIVQVLATNPNAPKLMFRIKKASALESVVTNRHLITPAPTLSTNDTSVFEFNMAALKDLLKKQAEQNQNASYFNIDILKYQIRPKPGAGSCPLQMVAYWKCTDDHTDLRVDYKYNGHAMANACPLLNLSVAAPIDGGVKNMQSKPNGIWMGENNRALWKLTELSGHVEGGGVGSLRGRFELSNGPGSQGTIAAQFNCEGTTLSGVDFELVGTGYRLSLAKKRFVSGKYLCDGDASPDNRYRYAAPPGGSDSSP